MKFGAHRSEMMFTLTCFLKWQRIIGHFVQISMYMMTSSNGNIFRVTGPLCGEFTGDRGIPLTKVSDVEHGKAGNMRRHRAHYDFIVVFITYFSKECHCLPLMLSLSKIYLYEMYIWKPPLLHQKQETSLIKFVPIRVIEYRASLSNRKIRNGIYWYIYYWYL